MNFDGKVVLVTGASRGIGAVLATAFAAAGATVAVNYRERGDAAEAVVAACRAKGGDALAVHADVTDATQVEAMIETVVGEFGRIDAAADHAARCQPLDRAADLNLVHRRTTADFRRGHRPKPTEDGQCPPFRDGDPKPIGV